MTDENTSSIDQKPLVIPVPDETGGPVTDSSDPMNPPARQNPGVKMNDQDYGMMKMQLIQAGNAAHSRRVDGADAYAENLRYDYLEGKDKLSFTESTGVRNVTGPRQYAEGPAEKVG